MDGLEQVGTAIEYMIRGLVEQPEAVAVEVIPYEDGALIRVAVAPTDRVRVIGIRGVTVRSLRVVVAAMGEKLNRKLSLEIAE
jgi:predicted RNA-binding protein YlqC (UPF0109 family)